MNDISYKTQSVINEIKVEVLKREVEKLTKRLAEQPCKQNCRTAKENYIAGYNDRDRQLYCVPGAEESWKEHDKS